MKRVPILKQLIRSSCDHEREFVDLLSQEERDQIGTLEQWSAKDLIAHIAAWRDRRAQELRALSHGERPRSEGEIDHENEVIYEAFQSRPWDEILEFAEHAFQSLLHQVSLLDEATLEEHLFPPPLEDRPLWREIVGTSYIHSILHLAQYYRERGDSAQVQALNEEMARSLPDLDPGPKWQGLVKYNLACHFSLSGEKSKAIPLLQEALELEPDLLEWSLQDPDFEPLRADPAYQAIYQS